METQIIDGKALAKEWQEKLKAQVARMERIPTLAVILVGNDPASEIYVRHKRQVAERVGITSELFQLSPVMTQEALIAFIQELNANDKVDGILVQLPLPKHMNATTLMEHVLAENVAYVPGEPFYANKPEVNHFRLSFVTVDPEVIREGVRRLAGVIKAHI